MRAYALLLLAAVAWATTYRGTAVGTEHASALVFSALRTIPTALVFLVLLRGRLPRLRPTSLLTLAGSGILTVTVYVYALSEGVARAGAANTAVLSTATPLLVAAGAWLVLRERLSLTRVVAVVTGFCGVVLMFASELHLGGVRVAVGMAVGLGAAAAWGAATVAVKWAVERDPDTGALPVVAVQYFAGCPLLLLLSAGELGTSGTDWSSPAFLGAVVGVGGAAAVGVLCYFAALRALSTTLVTTSLFLVPAFALLFEIGLGSPPSLVSGIGIAVTVASVAVATRPEEREASESRTT